MFMHDLLRSNPLRPTSLVSSPQLRRLIVTGKWILIALFLSADVITAAERQMLNGHVPKDVLALAAIDRLEKSQRLNFAIGLTLRNKPTLIKLIAALYD